jgi:hypothetical protein
VNVAVKGNEPGEWKTLMEGELCWKTNKDESIWSLEPGRYIQVSDAYLQCLFLDGLLDNNWFDSFILSSHSLS